MLKLLVFLSMLGLVAAAIVALVRVNIRYWLELDPEERRQNEEEMRIW